MGWGNLRKSCISLAPVALLFAAAPASAATRYASPTGNNMFPTCPQTDPCDLPTAIQQASKGDEVVVEAGDYTLDAPLDGSVSLNIHGPATGPLPEITQNAASPALFLSEGSTVSRLKLVATGGSGIQALNMDPDVVVDDLIVDEEAGNDEGVSLTSGDILRDTVVSTTGSDDVGVDAVSSPGATPDVYMRNDTVEVSSGDGVVSSGACLPNAMHPGMCIQQQDTDLSVKNVITRGGGSGYDLVANPAASGTAEGVIDIDHSNFRLGQVSIGSGAAINNNGGNQTTVNPMLTADYHELAGSVTIDAGTADPLNGAFDPDGNPRTYGPAPDIGAYEFPEQPIVALGAPTGLSATRATLNGTVNPRNVPGSYEFQWGATPNLGTVGTGTVPATDSPRAVTLSLAGLKPGATYYYKLTATTAAGTQSTSVRSLTTPPSLTRLRVRVRKRNAAFSFDVFGGSSVRIAVARLLPGRRVGRVCKPPSRKLRRNPRCTRVVALVTVSHNARNGLNTVAYPGRIGGKALVPGNYRAVFTARGPGGATAPQTVTFTIVRG